MIRRLLLLFIALPALAVTPIDEATSNAVERMVAAARVHPLVVVLAGDAVAKGEADLRAAMVAGLTVDQAKDIRAGLDTQAERERAVALLRMIGSDDDIVRVLSWVLSESRRVLASAPANPSVPSTGPPWQSRITRQMLFFSAPNYYWPEKSQAEVDAALDAILASGLDGPSVEFGGMFVADEYNHIRGDANVSDIYAQRLDQWAATDAGLRKRGLVAHIAFLNSNQSYANKISDAAWQEIARKWASRYGSENKLVLPLSEDDSRTRSSIGTAIYKGLLAGGFPRSQLISMSGSWGDWIETHNGRGKVPSGKNYRTIVVNDNGPSIGDLYGGDWRNGGKPNLANIEGYATELRARRCSGAVYSFGKVFDFDGLSAAARGWKAAAPSAPGSVAADAVALDRLHPGGSEASWKGWPVVCQITKVERVSRSQLRFTFSPRPAWKSDGGSKGINSNWSMFRADGSGGTFEYSVTTDPARDTRDCEPLVGVSPGETIYFVLTSIVRHGQRVGSEGRSQVFAWVVP